MSAGEVCLRFPVSMRGRVFRISRRCSCLAYTFSGGIHVEEYKNTRKCRIEALPPPAKVTIPLSQHIGKNAAAATASVSSKFTAHDRYAGIGGKSITNEPNPPTNAPASSLAFWVFKPLRYLTDTNMI